MIKLYFFWFSLLFLLLAGVFCHTRVTMLNAPPQIQSIGPIYKLGQTIVVFYSVWDYEWDPVELVVEIRREDGSVNLAIEAPGNGSEGIWGISSDNVGKLHRLDINVSAFSVSEPLSLVFSPWDSDEGLPLTSASFSIADLPEYQVYEPVDAGYIDLGTDLGGEDQDEDASSDIGEEDSAQDAVEEIDATEEVSE